MPPSCSMKSSMAPSVVSFGEEAGAKALRTSRIAGIMHRPAEIPPNDFRQPGYVRGDQLAGTAPFAAWASRNCRGCALQPEVPGVRSCLSVPYGNRSGIVLAWKMTEKVRENRLRRWAEGQGYKLEKSRRRDPRAKDYGTWRLIPERGKPKDFAPSMPSRHSLPAESPVNGDGTGPPDQETGRPRISPLSLGEWSSFVTYDPAGTLRARRRLPAWPSATNRPATSASRRIRKGRRDHQHHRGRNRVRRDGH